MLEAVLAPVVPPRRSWLAPALTRVPAPLTAPLKLLWAAGGVTVRDWPLRLTTPPVVPPPERPPMVSEALSRRMAPAVLATETLTASGTAEPPERASVPVLTVTLPVKELAPEIVTGPVPFLMRETAPVPLLAMTEETVVWAEPARLCSSRD